MNMKEAALSDISLEDLAIAISDLTDVEGIPLRATPADVLQDWILNKFPEESR